MDRWPLGVGVFSQAILAFMPEDEIAEILAYNERRLAPVSHYSAGDLMQRLATVRAAGHVFMTFPPLPGSEPKAGIAIPIFDPLRQPIASLCIIATEWRLRGETRTHHQSVLTREAEVIARRFTRRLKSLGAEESWRQAID